MKTQQQYWDGKINEWSSSSYGKVDKVSWVEKIASFFRAVNKRKEVALKLVGPKVRNKTVLDLGCGLGEFSIGLLLRYRPGKVILNDISEVAIKKVKKQIKNLRLDDRTEFSIGDVSTFNSLPDFNIVVGLGFIDYLKPDQLTYLFRLINDRPFLFSFFEKKFSLFNLLHKFYISIQGCPGAYKYNRKEIRSFLPNKTKIYFIKKEGLQFITNIKF